MKTNSGTNNLQSVNHKMGFPCQDKTFSLWNFLGIDPYHKNKNRYACEYQEIMQTQTSEFSASSNSLAQENVMHILSPIHKSQRTNVQVTEDGQTSLPSMINGT